LIDEMAVENRSQAYTLFKKPDTMFRAMGFFVVAVRDFEESTRLWQKVLDSLPQSDFSDIEKRQTDANACLKESRSGSIGCLYDYEERIDDRVNLDGIGAEWKRLVELDLIRRRTDEDVSWLIDELSKDDLLSRQSVWGHAFQWTTPAPDREPGIQTALFE